MAEDILLWILGITTNGIYRPSNCLDGEISPSFWELLKLKLVGNARVHKSTCIVHRQSINMYICHSPIVCTLETRCRHVLTNSDTSYPNRYLGECLLQKELGFARRSRGPIRTNFRVNSLNKLNDGDKLEDTWWSASSHMDTS